MVKFTVDIVKMVHITHRLQEDGSFKEVERGSHQIVKGDRIFNSYHEALAWKEGHPVIETGDVRIETSGGTRLGSPYLDIRQHRTAKPPKNYFTKNEVEAVLRRGNDDVHNTLVVDYDGNVHLVSNRDIRSEAYAVRVEGFQAGNGYVGPKSKLNHLDNTYKVMLEAWIVHLRTGDSEYRDYSDGRRSVEELQQEAETLVAEMTF